MILEGSGWKYFVNGESKTEEEILQSGLGRITMNMSLSKNKFNQDTETFTSLSITMQW